MDVQDDESLNKMEMKACRGLISQLNWAAESTTPDLAFDIRHLATWNKCSKISDIKIAYKRLKKAKYEDIRVKYSKLGPWRDLKIIAYTDSSFKNSEDLVKSIEGRVSFLANSQGMVSPLNWKSKTIQQVCKSVKSAETRSLGSTVRLRFRKSIFGQQFQTIRKLPSNEFNLHAEVVNSI